MAPALIKPVDLGDAPPLVQLPGMDTLPAMVRQGPQIVRTPTPLENEIGNTQQQLQKVRFAQTHPWGTAENHPGTMGKIAHVLSVAGNIAGDIFAPATMANIPGTQMHRELEEEGLTGRLAKELQQESTENEQEAQAENLRSESKEREKQKMTPLPTEHGIENYNPETGAVSPLGGATGPVMPYTKPGPRQKATLKGPHGEAIAATFDPQTGTYYDANDQPIENPQPFEKQTPPPHITVMVGGQPHIMERDPQTGAYSIDRGLAPPNYAMIAPDLKTYQTKDAATGENVTKTLGGRTLGPLADTTTMRNMGEMAATVQPMMDSVIGEVQGLANQIGPAVGRWNQFMVNKGGTDYPEFAGLDTDLDLLASAIVRTHFGARGGQEYRQELRKMFGEAQSPQDLVNRIQHAEGWIEGYARAGGVKTEHGNGPANPAAPPTGAMFKGRGTDGKEYWLDKNHNPIGEVK